jgi:TrmH family RNA methyltransferase
MEQISSPHNQHIKQVISLSTKSSARKQQGLLVIEGLRELHLATQAGYRIETLFVCPEIFCGTPPTCRKTFEITKSIFEKIAYRTGSDGILAVAAQKTHRVEDLQLGQNPFILLLEGVEKPGNIGAILRSADAAGVNAVIVCDPLCDIYNPNTVRASIGTLFSSHIACCTNQDAFRFLTQNNIRILAADLQATEFYQHTDMRGATAVAFGTEADGLSEFWLRNAHSRIKIAMRGCIDSLNVSVSAAVITFEAMRQRERQDTADF